MSAANLVDNIMFHTRQIKRTSSSTIKKLYALTNTSHSLMRQSLDDPSEHYCLVALTAKYNDNIIAWSLIKLRSFDGFVQVFVHPDFRRKGLGKNLLEKSIRYVKKYGKEKVVVRPWNDSSEKFFNKCNFDYQTTYEWRRNV